MLVLWDSDVFGRDNEIPLYLYKDNVKSLRRRKKTKYYPYSVIDNVSL